MSDILAAVFLPLGPWNVQPKKRHNVSTDTKVPRRVSASTRSEFGTFATAALNHNDAHANNDETHLLAYVGPMLVHNFRYETPI